MNTINNTINTIINNNTERSNTMNTINNTINTITDTEAAALPVCEICGEASEDTVVTEDGRTICIDCIEDGNFVYCDHCGEYVESSAYYINTAYGSEVWCECCTMDYSMICESCGERFSDDEIIWHERSDSYYCSSCYEDLHSDLVGYYHCGNPHGIQFYGQVAAWSYIKGYIGWELEFFGPTSRIAEAVYEAVGGFDFCHFEDDSTVDIEIVGQPRTLENIYAEADTFKAMFAAAREAGAVTDERAGLHVHISRTAFGDTPEEQAERIARVCMLFSNDEAFEKLARIACRSDFYWCEQLKNVTRDNLKRRASRVGGEHGIAVNLEHGRTVEFRLGRSMDNYDDFLAWIEVLAYIVKRSADIPEAVATCFDNWFSEAPKHIVSILWHYDIFDLNPIQVPTLADYEAIITALAEMVQDEKSKRNRTLMALGLDDEERPRIPSILDIVAKASPDAARWIMPRDNRRVDW